MKTIKVALWTLAMTVIGGAASAQCQTPAVGSDMTGQIARVDGRWGAAMTLTRLSEGRIRIQVEDGRGTDFETDLVIRGETVAFQLNFGMREFACQSGGDFVATWDGERNGQTVEYQAGFSPDPDREFSGF